MKKVFIVSCLSFICFLFFTNDVLASSVNDNFTDTAGTLLQNHTSDTGNTWSKQSVTTANAVITDANRIRSDAATVVYVNNWTPTSADYDVSADLYIASSNYNQTGIAGRAGASSFTGYYVLLVNSGGLKIQLYKGGGTLLGSYSIPLNIGETHNLLLRMRGTDIKVYWDKQPIIDVTDSSTSNAGLSGIYVGGSFTNTTGQHIDNFIATDDNFIVVNDTLNAGKLSSTDFTVSSSATLSWANATGGAAPVVSQLQRSLNGANTWTDVSGATTSPATDTGLSASTRYDYRVKYTDASSNIVYSNIVTVVTGATGNNNVSDTFTGTAGTLLENHTSDSGHLWTKNSVTSSLSNIVITDANRIRQNSYGANVIYYSNWVPQSANYNVSTDIYVANAATVSTMQNGICGRAGISTATGYCALFFSSSSSINLYRLGNTTPLGTYGVSLSTGETHTLKLSMSGNNIKVYWDGTSVIDVVATGSDIISTAGVVSIYTQYNLTNAMGIHLDNFSTSADSLSSGIISETLHTTTSATLSWTNATGGTAPVVSQLQRSPNGANTWTDVSGGTTSPATDTGLSASTRYDYRVKYTDALSNIVYSNILTVTTDAVGANTTYVIQRSDLWDNGYDNVSAPRQSPFARFIFTTDAGSITVTGNTNLYSSYPAYAHLGVRVNGVAQSPLIFTANGDQSFIVPLGATGTTRTVEIITGLQSTAGGAISKGSFVNSVVYPSTASFNVQTPITNNRILFYGDSISVGGNSTNPEYQAYVPLLRTTNDFNTMLEGWGYRALYDDTNTDTLRNVFISKLVSYNPSTIWFAIGTNDYGLNKWNASSFGTAYASVLDGLHSALPSARIICQTPIIRSSQVANGLGNTLSDYRTQIANICNSRNWTTLIDGSTFLSLSDLADGVHPTTAGHAKYANRIAPVLAQPGYAVSGPTDGLTSQASNTFTVTIGGNASFIGDQTINISVPDGIITAISTGGIITNNSSTNVTVTPVTGSTNFTFAYTPSTSGNKIISFTNGQNWTNPSSVTYNVSNLDVNAPTISSISSTPTSSASSISWITSKNSSSILDYGLTTSYGTTTEFDTSPRVQNHAVTISSLSSCITYHYRIRAKDIALNEGTSPDQTFTTSGCTASSTSLNKGSLQVNKTQGGTLTTGDNILTINIPAQFSSKDANFQIHQLDKATVLSTTSTPANYQQTGSNIYELKSLTDNSTVLSTFNNPLTVTIAYTPNDIIGLDESSLRIYRWDNSSWNQLSDCQVNTSNKTVSCLTNNFSVFGLFGQTQTIKTTSTTSGGSSIQNRIANLISMGQITQAQELAKQYNITTPTLTSTTVTSTLSNTFITKTLKLTTPRMVNNEIKTLQTYLNNHNYPSLTVDGVFGSKTKSNVILFQKDNNLVPDGIIGSKTREVMNK